MLTALLSCGFHGENLVDFSFFLFFFFLRVLISKVYPCATARTARLPCRWGFRTRCTQQKRRQESESERSTCRRSSSKAGRAAMNEEFAAHGTRVCDVHAAECRYSGNSSAPSWEGKHTHKKKRLRAWLAQFFVLLFLSY